MNWLAWNEPPPKSQTEKSIFLQTIRYHMISHSQLRPRTSCCILKSFFSRPGSPVKHYPGWEGNMIKQIKQMQTQHPAFWGKDEMMSAEAAVSRSLPRFAATTISLAHGPPTGISCPTVTILYCHLSLAIVITSIISLYILCLVTTVYQQGSLNCLYSEEQTKETEGRRMRVTPQIASEYGCTDVWVSVSWELSIFFCVLGTRWWLTCSWSSLFITIPPLWKSKPCLRGTIWSDMTISNETKCKLWTSMKAHNCCFKLKPSFLTYRFEMSMSLKKSNFSSGPGRWKYSWGTSGTHFFTFTSLVKTVLSPTGKKSVTHTHTRHTYTWKPPQTSKSSPSWNNFCRSLSTSRVLWVLHSDEHNRTARR